MKVEKFDYFLPDELIAQKPVEKRDESRLMCLDKKSGEIHEDIFKNIYSYFRPGDLLVVNDTRVIPARIYGKKIPTGTEIEFLLLNEIENDTWEVLVKPGKRVKKGVKITFGDGQLLAEILDYTDFGGRIVHFIYEGNFKEILAELGEMPLPPYIKSKISNPERYQTVYSREEGSAAAPTAGLHFTPELLKKIEKKGVSISRLTLHVGLGTFRPVRTDTVEGHDMHAEYYELSSRTAEKITNTKKQGGRVIAVGTTVTRTLETIATKFKRIIPDKGWTDIFIYPGYKFKVIDGLITNFHLPRSTLIMLVSAFAGRENIMRAYNYAVKEEYRFFSLGDAMYIS